MADVELPGGRHLAHRFIRTPPGAGVVAIDGTDRVLLIWRHRFITDSWGWEIPIGKIEDGEAPIQAAAREFEEETGWQAGELRHLIDVQPTPGLTNSEHHIYVTDEATYVGKPVDGFEAERIEWVPLSGVCSLIEKQNIVSGTTLAALLYVLSKARLHAPEARGWLNAHCLKLASSRFHKDISLLNVAGALPLVVLCAGGRWFLACLASCLYLNMAMPA